MLVLRRRRNNLCRRFPCHLPRGRRLGVALGSSSPPPSITSSVPSPDMSIEELPSPPRTRKGKEKEGENVWIDPATALG